jgi:signal transduction histidine kinase
MVARSLDRMEGMRKLIADLLDMTQIESGRKNRQLAAVDVAEIARAALDAVRPEAARQGVTVCLQDNGPVAMTADRREMEMIFNNLLSNAVKYNRPQGRVDVRLARSAAGQLSIRVADSGIGMTAEESVQLFDEFVRIKNDKTLHILGSGLGLSIVKKIALLYDGDATVESRPDAGSTFTVVLNDPTKNDPAK